MLAYSRSTATVTERSSGTRYSRKNSGGTPPSKPYPLSQQLPDRGSEASKCRPTKLIPPPTSATRRQRKQSFQMSSDKANSPSLSQRPADRGSKASKCRPTKLIPPPSVSNSQTEEARLPNVVRPPKKIHSLNPQRKKDQQ